MGNKPKKARKSTERAVSAKIAPNVSTLPPNTTGVTADMVPDTAKAARAIIPAGQSETVDLTEAQIEALRDRIPAKGKSFAHAIIQRVYDRVMGEGGLADIQAQETAVRGSIAQDVYALALQAVELAGNNLAIARAYFQALCKEAETFLRNAHKNPDGTLPQMQKLLPVWAVYKSNILRGMTEGLNPAEERFTVKDAKTGEVSPSEAKFRKATVDKVGPRGGGARVPGAGAGLPIGIADDQLKAVLAVLLPACAKLSMDQQREASKLLAQVHAEILKWTPSAQSPTADTQSPAPKQGTAVAA